MKEFLFYLREVFFPSLLEDAKSYSVSCFGTSERIVPIRFEAVGSFMAPAATNILSVAAEI